MKTKIFWWMYVLGITLFVIALSGRAFALGYVFLVGLAILVGGGDERGVKTIEWRPWRIWRRRLARQTAERS